MRYANGDESDAKAGRAGRANRNREAMMGGGAS